MSETLGSWPDGSRYLVTGERDTAAGRALEFALWPDGRKVWVTLGDLDDTPERRETIADALLHGKRYLRGARLAPPYTQPPAA